MTINQETYLVVGNQLFLDDFHGINAFGPLKFHHKYFGIASSANDSDKVKVRQRNTTFCISGSLNWRHLIIGVI